MCSLILTLTLTLITSTLTLTLTLILSDPDPNLDPDSDPNPNNPAPSLTPPQAQEVCSKKYPFQRLVLSKAEALEMFASNPFKVSARQQKAAGGSRRQLKGARMHHTTPSLIRS